MSRKLGIPVAVLTTAALGLTLAGLATPADAATSHSLPGSVPSWANAAHKAGAASSSEQVDFRVYLDWQGGSAAADYATAVSTPGNALYGKFLSANQFAAKFAPSAGTVNSVKSWLKGQGFTVGHVPANSKYVEAVGTVGQAAKAFSTSFATYKVEGKTLRSNNSPLVVPDSLSGVQAVVGLDESAALVHHDSNPPAVFNNARPCSEWWGEKTVQNTATPDNTVLPATPSAFAPCGYAGAQLQGAYGMDGAIASGNDGRGVTVGIIDAYASTTMLSDANRYSSEHGLPSLNGHYSEHVAPGTKVRPQNPRQDPEGWSGEQTLDVEAVHTMAPGADILYVGSPNNYQDMDAALNWIVSRHAADIVTNSYGFSSEALPPGYIKPQNDILIQAAATGISMFFSSGDDSDETGGVAGATPTPDWPASSPWVTAVGGTSLGVGQDNSRIFELGWATAKSTLSNGAWTTPAYLYGSGGGTSRLFTQPSYQAGVVDPAMSQRYGGPAMRVVPDVSALGDPTTGMRVGQTQTWPDGHVAYSEYRIGGTSLASPLYAGMFALVVQRAGHDFGLANPVLYHAAANDITKAQRSTYPGAVRVDFANGVDAGDGYVYSARWFDVDEPLTIHVRPGYDDITGVGTPAGQAWLDYLAAQ
ncbi:subtilase family serine protease [Marmoricola sp. URHA0025 HA25]